MSFGTRRSPLLRSWSCKHPVIGSSGGGRSFRATTSAWFLGSHARQGAHPGMMILKLRFILLTRRSSSARFGRRSGPAPEVWTLRLPVTGVGISRRIGPRFPLPRSGLTGLFFARSPKLLSTKLQAWTAGRALHWPHFPQCFGPPYLTSGMPRLLSVVFRMPGCRYGFACWRRRREAFALWRSHQQFGAFWLELSTQSCEAGCWCGLTRPGGSACRHVRVSSRGSSQEDHFCWLQGRHPQVF